MSMNRMDRTAGNRPMNRRQLLQRLGMIGGSSFVMSVMNAWELLGQPSGRRPALRGNQPDTRVIILGAGMSGLVTGYELGKLGYDYQILEARDRVGGLNWTIRRGTEHRELDGGERQVCQFDEGNYLNAGPWRIPHSHHGIIGYCKELNVRLEQYIDDNLVLFSPDPSLGPLANRKVYLREVRSDMWGHVAELLAKAIDQNALDENLSTEDRERLVQFLTRAGYLSDPDRIYRPDARMRGSDERYDLELLLQSPFANQIRSVSAGTGGPDPVFQPTGGMMQIPLAFQREIGHNITHNAIVQSIRQTTDEVRVVYRDAQAGETRELIGDFVVSCLPMSILKTLDIDLSPAMRDVVTNSFHSSQAKLGLQMKRRFWEEDDGIYGGHLVYYPTANAPRQGGGGGGNPLPQFSYPSNDYGSLTGVILGFYGNGNIPGLNGQPLSQLPVRDRIDHVLTHARNVHPQIADEFDNGYAVWWDRVEHSLGAWATNPGNRLEQLSKPDGRLYIGSAAASSDPAWMEGAVESAWRAVEAIHQRVLQS